MILNEAVYVLTIPARELHGSEDGLECPLVDGEILVHQLSGIQFLGDSDTRTGGTGAEGRVKGEHPGLKFL